MELVIILIHAMLASLAMLFGAYTLGVGFEGVGVVCGLVGGILGSIFAIWAYDL